MDTGLKPPSRSALSRLLVEVNHPQPHARALRQELHGRGLAHPGLSHQQQGLLPDERHGHGLQQHGRVPGQGEDRVKGRPDRGQGGEGQLHAADLEAGLGPGQARLLFTATNLQKVSTAAW